MIIKLCQFNHTPGIGDWDHPRDQKIVCFHKK